MLRGTAILPFAVHTNKDHATFCTELKLWKQIKMHPGQLQSIGRTREKQQQCNKPGDICMVRVTHHRGNKTSGHNQNTETQIGRVEVINMMSSIGITIDYSRMK